MPPSPHVLFLGPDREDYLADGLFHGLRTLLGERVVDFPKLDRMYDSLGPERVHGLYGHGFGLYGLLPDIEVDRVAALERARLGHFDLVVFADIWSAAGAFADVLPDLGGTRLAFVDGADRPEMVPYGERWWRSPSLATVPRPHRRGLYFKRELTPDTAFFRWFMAAPRATAGHLPLPRSVRPTSFSIPESKIDPGDGTKTKDFASHCVDPQVAARIGAQTGYGFDDEAEYHADLRASRFGVCTRRAGWDSLRPYEMAAQGCVPCFRDLEQKPDTCAPHGLDAGNCVPYTDPDELLARVASMSAEEYARLREGAVAWARANTTEARAQGFLDQVTA